MKFPRVKICCISSIQEANLAIKYGASALGLVGRMPSGPGVVEDSIIKEIVTIIPPGIASFLLSSETKINGIISHHLRTNTNTLQLVDYVGNNVYKTLKEQLPYLKLVQVIHVIDEKDIKRSQLIAPFVDALLLDSGNPNLKVKVLGGTGNIHNWEISRKIRNAVSIPVFLAGGLNSENVKQAIEEVSPFGIDLCNSVRTNGKLDEYKLDKFFNTVYS